MKKLTTEQKQILLDFGYPKQDFKQIEKALSKTELHLLIERKDDEPISIEKAIELLGQTAFLSGLSRSAFHYSAIRHIKEGQSVYFNSAKLFR